MLALSSIVSQIRQSLVSILRGFRPPTSSLTRQDLFVIGLSVLRSRLQNLIAFPQIPLMVVVLFVSLVFCFCSLAVRSHAISSRFSFAADRLTLSTSPIPEFSEGSIPCGEFVSSDAMGFGRLFSTEDILVESDRLQVIGIDASGDSAQVIQNQSIWNRTFELLPRENVREPMLAIKTEAAVAVFVQPPTPKPASRSLEDESIERLIDRASTGNRRTYVWPESAMAPREVPSSDIFPIGARLQVIWVDAVRNSALVIQRERIRDWAVGKFVRKPMGVIAFTVTCKSSVAGIVDSSDPKPATGGFQNPLIEGLIQRQRARHRLNQYAAIPAWETST